MDIDDDSEWHGASSADGGGWQVVRRSGRNRGRGGDLGVEPDQQRNRGSAGRGVQRGSARGGGTVGRGRGGFIPGRGIMQPPSDRPSLPCARASRPPAKRGQNPPSVSPGARGATPSPPIDSKAIKKLSAMDPRKMVRKVYNQLKEFQRALGDAMGNPQIMDCSVKILLNLTILAREVETEEQSMASTIVEEVLSERSENFSMQLNRAVLSSACTLVQAKQFCDLFYSMLERFESLAWDFLPIDELHETIKGLTRATKIDFSLLKTSEDMCKFRDQIRDKEENPVIFHSGEGNDSDYKHIPILPEWEEIKEDNGTPQEVRPNKISAPYKDWMEYYDIQFRLVREDFIAPLRRGVAAFLQGERGRKNRDVKTYSSAKIVSQVTTKGRGICFSIQFDVSGFRKVNYNWNHSKRLIFGSLLCFIPVDDKSESSVIFATVTEREVYKLKEGKIMVQCEGDILQAMTHCRDKTEFEMIESSSYFEGTAPILRSIQKAEVETMPFTKQIILGDCNAILPPVYLRANEEPPVYNLACLRGSRRRQFKLMVNILDKESWEAARDSELDSSQLNAIQTALTQEIAVIQGPPGTGKTYIGLKIVEGLLENRHIWYPRKSSPILVMCYTNHALDQFLEGIIDTKCCGRELKVIRIGGRCKNEKVEAHNIKKVRKRHYNSDYSAEIARLIRELDICDPQRAFRKLESHCNRTSLLSLGDVQNFVDPNHYYQLTEMVKCKEQKGNEMEVWLGLWTEKCLKLNQRHHKATLSQNEQVHISKHPHNNMLDLDSQAKDEKMNEERINDYDAEDERMDDYDAEEYEAVELVTHEVEPKPQYNHYQDEYSDDESENEEVTQRKPQRYRREDADKVIIKKLRKKSMDEDEANDVENITSLNNSDRWRLYNYWEEQRYKYLQRNNRRLAQQYTETCREIAQVRQLEDGDALERADVIGMTTSGAAKYQHILHRIKPKIVIVEEAAEVLEAHIVSALSAGTQHLILIGDHKQLRPKPNEHVLATKYNLSISLFERLVMKQMSQATLEIQHRMRPEIAQLVCPHIYEKLLNHESVEKYPDIRGIEKNMFFVCHTEPESEDPNLLSYQNEFEARYIVGLCSHLLNLGYSPTQITILTPYVGQLLLLKDKIAEKGHERVSVTAIDNFQGEENDIILFSMVRSTNFYSNRTTIGFVTEDNRVCVSLSRAKHGFYAIGNFELIRHQSPLWESIISDVESRGCYGNALPLYCYNHPETKYSAKKESDFKTNAPNGGCMKGCDIRLPCGHSCSQTCHVKDRKHAKFKCIKACRNKCPNDHPCKYLCHIKCPPCSEKVQRVMPKCGHTQKMKCSQHPKAVKCKEMVVKTMNRCGHEQEMFCSTHPNLHYCQAPCTKACEEGHPCRKKCYEDCSDCTEYVEKEMPICHHKQLIPCPFPPILFKCRAPCTKSCTQCQTPCERTCSEPCGSCKVLIVKTVPECGHKQTVMCCENPKQANCTKICTKKCPNELHDVRKRCNEKWPNCREQVIKLLPRCLHVVTAECFHDSSSILCEHPCTKHCKEGHICPKKCHEKCAPCLTQVKKTLHCGHTHSMSCFQASKNTFKCPSSCSKQTCEKGHRCPKTCHYPQPCEPCSEIVCIKLQDCSHEQKVKCYMSMDPKSYKLTCDLPCERKLKCDHTCRNKCGQKCQKVCTEKVLVGLPCGHHTKIECNKKTESSSFKCQKMIDSIKIGCGHTVKAECWKQKDHREKALLRRKCQEKCTRQLQCTHPCKEICSKPCTKNCAVRVTRKLSCGHNIKTKCSEQPGDYCTEKCSKKLSCGHPCTKKCGEPCSDCYQKSTRHYPCGHSSKIPCNSTVEAYPCKKKCSFIFSCGHRCSGKCGDCYSSRMHAICVFQIRLHHFCGHSLTLPCAGLSDFCDQETHDIPCTHKQDYSKCRERCSWACKHYQCRKRCEEECDRPPCNKPCDRIMHCGHICPGLCGEWCLSVCFHCDLDRFTKQFYPKPKQGKPVPRNQPFFELSCGHIFTVKYLDECMDAPTVRPRQCPKCYKNIYVGNRYGNAVRRAITDVHHVKRIQQAVLELPVAETKALLDKSWWENFKPAVPKNSMAEWRTLDAIRKELKSSHSITAEDNCLVQCADSFFSLSLSLELCRVRVSSVLRTLLGH